MDILNICSCGTQASYPHKADCPWPNYSDSPVRQEEWLAARNKKRALSVVASTLALAASIHIEAVSTTPHLAENTAAILARNLEVCQVLECADIYAAKLSLYGFDVEGKATAF